MSANKVYIASPFFYIDQTIRVDMVEDLLQSMQIDYFSPRDIGVIKDMTEDEKENSTKMMYDKNIYHLGDCDVLVCIVDDKDTGTLFELGYFTALKDTHEHDFTNPAIITVSFTEKPVNLMLRYAVDAHATNLAQLQSALDDLERYGRVRPENRNLADVNE